MKRLTLALVAFLLSLAFAPAPLPRPKREAGADVDLTTFQGLWKVVEVEMFDDQGGRKDRGWKTTTVRVEGDRWTYLVDGKFNAEYRLEIDAKRKPTAIDFFDVRTSVKPFMIGLIRRKGDGVEIVGTSTEDATRVRGFGDPPSGWWRMTLRRDG